MRHRSTRLLVLFALLAVVIVAWWVRRSHTALRPAKETASADPKVVARFLELEAREREVEQRVWAKEMLAQECARVFESWWDALNAATNKLRVLAAFPVGEVVVGKFNRPINIAHGIKIHSPSGDGRPWTAIEWEQFLQASQAGGLRTRSSATFNSIRMPPASRIKADFTFARIS